MPPKPKKNATPDTPKRGTHKSRRKQQPPPEIQATADLASTDDSATLRNFTQTLGNLTTALATISSKLDHLEQGKLVDITSARPAVAVLSAQPATRAGGNFTATVSQVALVSAQPGTRAWVPTSTSPIAESDLEQNICNRVQHPVLAITDDDTDGEEEARPQTARLAAGTSGKLRSANTASMYTVI